MQLLITLFYQSKTDAAPLMVRLSWVSSYLQ